MLEGFVHNLYVIPYESLKFKNIRGTIKKLECNENEMLTEFKNVKS